MLKDLINMIACNQLMMLLQLIMMKKILHHQENQKFSIIIIFIKTIMRLFKKIRTHNIIFVVEVTKIVKFFDLKNFFFFCKLFFFFFVNI